MYGEFGNNQIQNDSLINVLEVLIYKESDFANPLTCSNLTRISEFTSLKEAFDPSSHWI